MEEIRTIKVYVEEDANGKLLVKPLANTYGCNSFWVRDDKLVEKEDTWSYLRNLIRPYGKRFVYVSKIDSTDHKGMEVLIIKTLQGIFIMPPFDKGSMFKEMVYGRRYEWNDILS